MTAGAKGGAILGGSRVSELLDMAVEAGRQTGPGREDTEVPQQESAQAAEPCEWASSLQNPDVTWVERLEVDLEKRKELQEMTFLGKKRRVDTAPQSGKEERKQEGKAGTLENIKCQFLP